MSIQNILNKSVSNPNNVTFAELTVDTLTCNHLIVGGGLGSTAQNLVLTQPIQTSLDTIALFPNVTVSDPGLSYSPIFSRWTVQEDGFFTITWSVAFDSSSSVGYRWTWMDISGGTVRLAANNTNALTGAFTTLSSSYSGFFAAGSSFAIHVFQNSGGNLNLIGSSTDGLNMCSVGITRNSIV